MSDDVTALVEIIKRAYLYAIPTHSIVGVPEAILASDWLAGFAAAQRAEALREAADVADRGTITGLETTRPDIVAIWLRRRADREARP